MPRKNKRKSNTKSKRVTCGICLNRITPDNVVDECKECKFDMCTDCAFQIQGSWFCQHSSCCYLHIKCPGCRSTRTVDYRRNGQSTNNSSHLLSLLKIARQQIELFYSNLDDDQDENSLQNAQDLIPV